MTVHTEQASFWDGRHLRVAVSYGEPAGNDTAQPIWAGLTLGDPDGTFHLGVEVGDGAVTPDPARTTRVAVQVRGEAEVMMLVEALEWSGRHLRELVERHRTAAREQR